MTQPSPAVAQQAEALIQMLRDDETAACARETEQATVRARDLLRAAFGDARQMVRAAVQEERDRRDNAIRQAQAAVATRRRQQSQRDASHVVHAAWACLPRVLHSIWNDPPQRLAWCYTAIDGASRVLRPDRWEIVGPATLTPAELAALSERAHAVGVREAVAKPDNSLPAGILIRSAGAVFDATTAGILANQAAIEAELHAVWLAELAA